MFDLIVEEIFAERVRQDAKWGEQDHTPSRWLDILMEEVGEYAKAILPLAFGGGSLAEAREEMVQVAAVAIAAIESIDRC